MRHRSASRAAWLTLKLSANPYRAGLLASARRGFEASLLRASDARGAIGENNKLTLTMRWLF